MSDAERILNEIREEAEAKRIRDEAMTQHNYRDEIRPLRFGRRAAASVIALTLIIAAFVLYLILEVN